MMFCPNPRIEASQIDAFESQLGFGFPTDYRTLLANTNGGVFRNEFPTFKADIIGDICCNALFGFGVSESLDIQVCWREFQGEIPEKSVIIGNDPGGGLFLLCCGPDDQGIYYYDHGYGLPNSSDEGNTYRVCDTFSQFMALVGISSSH